MNRLPLSAWIILACLGLSYSDCPQGWFGSSCQYKCRCEDYKCDKFDGSCLNGVKCLSGWFGPACQYADLAQTDREIHLMTPVSLIIDGSEKTCLIANEVTLSFSAPLQLSWFRVHVRDSYYLDKLKIQFKQQSNPSLLACENNRTALVSDTAQDIYCDLAVAVTQVILTGESVQSLCSFYISGGRNVALKQKTTQSSLYDSCSHAFKAVDGDTSSHFEDGHCTHTKKLDPKPTWNVTLSHPASVNRYVVYNRDEATYVDKRLQGFILTSFDPVGAEVFRFTDTAPTEQAIYTVTSVPTEVQTVSIRVVKNHRIDEYFLTLCEVEVYGYYVCEPGLYGRECEHKCNCADRNDTCFVSTGGCPSGCPPGYQGEDCRQECDRGTFGQDCNSICPQHCENVNTSLSVCDHVSGVCTHGCLSGYTGDHCEEHCDRGTHGQGCNSTCPQHCENINTSLSVCDHVSGTCTQGCLSGYKGDHCDKHCDGETHGRDCKFTCPQHCGDSDTSLSVCDHISGVCTQGCQTGYKGDHCDELHECPHTECDRGTFGQDCNATCPQHCENINTRLSSCDHVSGVCTQGCLSGYTGDHCEKHCDRGRHGQGCNSTCPQHCENINTSLSVCDHVSGVCTQGCLSGYKGDHCDEHCDSGRHGQGCNSTCPQHCEDINTSLSVCDHVSGVCTQGCLSGYKGDRCDEPKGNTSIDNNSTFTAKNVPAKKEDSLTYSTSRTAGAVVGGIIVALVVVVGVIILWRIKKFGTFKLWTISLNSRQRSESTAIIMTTEMFEVDRSVQDE